MTRNKELLIKGTLIYESLTICSGAELYTVRLESHNKQ